MYLRVEAPLNSKCSCKFIYDLFLAGMCLETQIINKKLKILFFVNN